MGRKDYQGLLRDTRLVLYGGSWLERQNNTKMIQAKVEDAPAPLAKELGRNWYIRLPDSDCQEARTFAQERAAFWTLLRETWDKVLVGDRPFIEKPGTQPARYEKITGIQETYFSRDFTDPGLRAEVENEILTAINAYRAIN